MTEDEVLRQIQALVAAGEYLDELLGVPGARLSGGGAFKGKQRLYARGTPEHLEARAAGLVEKLPPLKPPASVEAIKAVEHLLGRRLPSLLRRLYMEVGNGGFGPGYGIIGLPDRDDERHPRNDLRRERWNSFPASRSLFPLCDWGCGIYSFVDCADAEARMWAWDPNSVASDQIAKALFREELLLREWLGRWVNRRSFQPCLVQDPDSDEWRGATEEEKAKWMSEWD
jgi:SMI1 / KNR4 family (SUKH-1)